MEPLRPIFWEQGMFLQPQHFQQRSVPGLRVYYREVPLEELPRRAHCNHFEIDQHGQLWRRIEQRQNISIVCQLPPDKTEMPLLVLYDT